MKGSDEEMKSTKTRYGAIDGLRTIACFGIVLMHMATNNEYAINGFIYESVIPAFTNFVFLFMTVSAFGMCCGYYEKMLGKNVDGTPQLNLTDFYKKRFMKVLPFFAVLCLLDVAISPSISSIYEAFADITLLFGFMNKTINVIGVGWFLGLIFVFYLIFPFFCVLIENKLRAWISFGVSLIYLYVCTAYFSVGRTNILYSGCFFIAGGLIYLYRDSLSRIAKEKKWSRWAVLIIVALTIVFYFAINDVPVGCLLVSVALLLYAVMASKPSESMRGGYRTYAVQQSSGEQIYSIHIRHQHGDLSVSHGDIQGDRENRPEYSVWKWRLSILDDGSDGTDRSDCVFGCYAEAYQVC